jgi:hypothetical protein
MIDQRQAGPRQILFFGIVTALAGGYFTLVGAGLLPIPGGPANLHAPQWILLCVGLAFFFTGMALLIQRFGRADAHGELPADAPSWLRIMQYMIGVGVFACFALIGSWIAFWPGEREFSGTIPFLSVQTNETIGRAAFGIGAIISWGCGIGFAVWRGRKLFSHRADRQRV